MIGIHYTLPTMSMFGYITHSHTHTLTERQLEDHECVVDVYSHWARDTNNQFMFKLMEDKYDLFENPTVSGMEVLSHYALSRQLLHEGMYM